MKRRKKNNLQSSQEVKKKKQFYSPVQTKLLGNDKRAYTPEHEIHSHPPTFYDNPYLSMYGGQVPSAYSGIGTYQPPSLPSSHVVKGAQ